MPEMDVRPTIQVKPLIAERWADLEQLFGKRGACGGCWCMYWRLKRREYEQQKGSQNRRALRQIVDSGKIPGLLAFMDDRPVGWCALAPRENFPALDRSRVLKRVDDQPVWSIVCFFIDKNYREQGISLDLIKAAAEYVRFAGGKIIEGYPVEPKKPKTPPHFAFTGLASAFRRAGFQEVVRRSETRPIMRLYL